ncbi:CYTH domain-containing protein [Cytobacillus gottheilii]|uniref:CYTH domain-containing protein n=1 Tax=Cytobacillus gottheilii TaxID=859144 RepID=UPI0009BC0D8F|nr:CYTH domain-containing protein [Cytobacillus gottheilii]
MDKHIEIEFKNMLTKSEFELLKESLKFNAEDFKSQTNYYFDTPDFQLKKKHSALRIREKNGYYELTLKQPHEHGLLESNDTLTAETAQKAIHAKNLNQKELLQHEILSIINDNGIAIEDLTLFGSLKTIRAEKKYKDGLLVLDNSYYLNEVDYELEYEVSDRANGEVIFGDLLAEYRIPIRKTENKVRRLYNRKSSL